MLRVRGKIICEGLGKKYHFVGTTERSSNMAEVWRVMVERC